MADEKNDGALTTLASIVPEAAYDVVARLLPGLVSLAAAFYVYNCFLVWILHRPIRWVVIGKEAPSFGWLFVSAIACWMLGFMLNPLGDHLLGCSRRDDNYCKAVERFKELLLKAAQLEIVESGFAAKISAEDSAQARLQLIEIREELFQQINVHLKGRQPEWRGLLLKIQAEMMFYANVSAGLMAVIAAEALLTPLAFYLLSINLGGLSARSLVGYGACSLLPLLPAAISWREMHDKYKQLWTRQMALLVADFRTRGSPSQGDLFDY